MKKIYLFFILCFSLTLSAQLTRSNHAPAPGNDFVLLDCDPANIDPGPAGTGVQWVFSGNTTTVAPSSYKTLAINSNTQYPNAKVGVATSPTNTAYYFSDETVLHYYGGNIPVPNAAAEFIYTQPAIKAVYPMSVNSTSTSAIAGSVNVTSPFATTGTFTGSSSALCDGTGTLTVGTRTTTNVYRVITTQTINFTTSLLSGQISQRTYDYFEPDTKAPLFTIVSTTLTSALANGTLVSVSKLDSYIGTGLSEVNAAGPFRIYPNPASTEIKVLSPEKDYVLNVFDMTGKLVSTTILNSGVNRMDVSRYAKGLYVYRIEDIEGTVKSTGKLTIIQ